MKRFLMALALLLASLPAPASADHYWLSGNGQPMHWQRGGAGMPGYLTIDGIRYIGVHNGMDQGPVVQGILNEATERWNDSHWHAAHLTPSNLPPSSFPYPCDWTPPPSGWGVSICYGQPNESAAQASAQLMGVDQHGHINWVQILVRPGLSVDQTRTVLTHELGHALGLAHNFSDGDQSVMAPNSGNTSYPAAHDKDVVARLYSHAH